jgi:hypothetical protein
MLNTSLYPDTGTFPTKKECDARTNSRPPPDTPGLRCLSAEDLARAKAVDVGWLLMMAPHDDVTASLAQWAAKPEAGPPPTSSPVKRPATNIEIVCSGGASGWALSSTSAVLTGGPRSSGRGRENFWRRAASRTTTRA